VLAEELASIARQRYAIDNEENERGVCCAGRRLAGTEYNEVNQEFFPPKQPARATVQAHLPGDVIVEIQAIAVLDGA
jgi:Bacterial transcriptional regulator